jgi:hypothetical protein
MTDPHLKVIELHGRAIYHNIGIAWRKSSSLQSSYEQLAAFFRNAVETELADLARIG